MVSTEHILITCLRKFALWLFVIMIICIFRALTVYYVLHRSTQEKDPLSQQCTIPTKGNVNRFILYQLDRPFWDIAQRAKHFSLIMVCTHLGNSKPHLKFVGPLSILLHTSIIYSTEVGLQIQLLFLLIPHCICKRN